MFEYLWLHTLHAKPWENESELFSGQCLSEDIRQLILCPYEMQVNHSILYLFSNEMMSDVDVFRPRVLDIVAVESYGNFFVTIQRNCHGGVFWMPNTHVDGSLEIPKDPFNCLKVLFSGLRLISSTHAHSKNQVRLDRRHPWRILVPEETLTKCHTMHGEPILTRKVLSSDDRHDVDVLGQQSLQVALAINILIASRRATGAKDSSKSRPSS
ncbi:hypothetical protein Tco_1478288 [Tanacetum coccineum]